jgi:hypothetical protein
LLAQHEAGKTQPTLEKNIEDQLQQLAQRKQERANALIKAREAYESDVITAWHDTLKAAMDLVKESHEAANKDTEPKT